MRNILAGATRVSAAALAATLALASLAGCSTADQAGTPSSSGAAPAENVTLTMTIWGSDTDQKVMEERLALAKAALPNITVNLQLIAKDYDTKVQTMFAGGQAPDIMMTAEAVNVYSSKGQLEDLNPYFAAEGVDPVAAFGPGSVNTYSTDGKLWGAPDRSGAAVVYYNKGLFDAAGVAYPSA
ncbi:MAG: extracellular solute-binding protein, partial [Propionibacteriaceae bacterium]|nr:extracellular solute-binding protein [Propionibacteriaceae bacterium]